MPLSCLLHGRPIYAFDFDDDGAWTQLREVERPNLSLPCCGSRVVPKTSSLGTRFFAHARRGDCTSGPEGPEHLLAKAIIARAAKACGWQAFTEHREDGWIADVLVSRMGSSRLVRVAFEVQWSSQTEAETRARQGRYAEAGVRCLWLMRRPACDASHELPVFALKRVPDQSDFDVSFGRWGHNKQRLADFVQGALTGKLSWRDARTTITPARIVGASERCWSCKNETTVVVGLMLDLSAVFPGRQDTIVPFPKGYDAYSQFLGTALRKQRRIGAIKERWSRTEGSSYLSNGCWHCGALQGQFFLDQMVRDAGHHNDWWFDTLHRIEFDSLSGYRSFLDAIRFKDRDADWGFETT